MGHADMAMAVSAKAAMLPEPDAAYLMPNEPAAMREGEVDALLLHAATLGASDVHFLSEEPVLASVSNQIVHLTRRALDNGECDFMTNLFYGPNGVARLKKGDDIDTAYSVSSKDGRSFRFRVNVTACTNRGREGSQITLRVINSVPAPLETLGVEKQIVDSYRIENGLVLVCGATGSGKSTLLAAMIREILMDPEAHRKIITYEAPIEYVYDSIPRSAAMISQHEIPRHLPDWERAVRNSLRRAPSIILVGESRDHHTMSAALEASETGHMLMSTVHCNSVAEGLYRMVNMFPPGERGTKMFEIIEALRLMVVQKLVRRTDRPGRVALREFLVFDQSVRDRMRHAQTLRDAVALVGKLVEKQGQSMLRSAYRERDAGRISHEEVVKLEVLRRNDVLDDLDLDAL